MHKDLTVAVRDFIALDDRVTHYQENDIAPSTTPPRPRIPALVPRDTGALAPLHPIPVAIRSDHDVRNCDTVLLKERNDGH